MLLKTINCTHDISPNISETVCSFGFRCKCVCLYVSIYLPFIFRTEFMLSGIWTELSVPSFQLKVIKSFLIIFPGNFSINYGVGKSQATKFHTFLSNGDEDRSYLVLTSLGLSIMFYTQQIFYSFFLDSIGIQNIEKF